MFLGEERTSSWSGRAPTTGSPNLFPFLNARKVGILSTRQSHERGSGRRDAYGSDTSFLGDVTEGITINLVEADGCVLCQVGELFEDGADRPAWSTPGCPKVDDNDLVLGDLLIIRGVAIKSESLGIPGLIMIKWAYDLIELGLGIDWDDGHGDLDDNTRGCGGRFETRFVFAPNHSRGARLIYWSSPIQRLQTGPRAMA